MTELLPAPAVQFAFLTNIRKMGSCEGAAADKTTSIAYLFEEIFLESFKKTVCSVFISL